MWLLYISCAWVAGVFLGSKVDLPFIALSFGVLPFLLIPFFSGRKKTLVMAAICLFAVLGGDLRFPSNHSPADEHSLSFYNVPDTTDIQGTVAEETDVREILHIRGIVAEEPDIRARFCQLTFSANDVTVNGQTQEVSGTALVLMPRYPAYHYGDVLKITGMLETPAPFDDFDYTSYLARQGIHSVIYYPKIELLGRGEGLKPLQWIYSLRERLSASLARALPEPQGSLAQGILLGLRGNIPDSLNEAFSRTGTAHLLAISGLNISIIAAMLLSFGILVFGRRRSIYIWLALVTTWFYTLLAGANPPVIRAAIMASLFLMAEYLGRQQSAITALSFAAALMVGIQPQILWSIPFQLSFLAMTGLIFLYPRFQAWGRKLIAALSRGKESIVAAGGMLTDGSAVTLAAIVVVWPLVAYNFGVVSSVGLPATFFSLPALPAIIVTAALVAFVGLFPAPMAPVLGWIAWLFITYFLSVVRVFDALPFSHFSVDTVYSWQVWAYYVALAAAVVSVGRMKMVTGFVSRLASGVKRLASGIPKPGSHFPAKWLILPLLFITSLLWSVVLTSPDDSLHVSFLDVGQGDAILIQTPLHQNILIDGGPDPQGVNLALGKKLPFWDRTIDLMIATQPQADHIAGLVEVLQRYEVKQVLEPGLTYDSTVYQEWLRLVREKQIKHEIARAGQEIDLGEGIRIEVLNPPSVLFEGTSADIDNNGIALRLSSGEISFLFTADIREEAEFKLLGQRANLRSTVLKVAHHGSKTSTSPQFLAAVAPELAVISVGTDNPFGHPSPEVVERLVDQLGENKLYRTDRDGTIEFITDGASLWVTTEK